MGTAVNSGVVEIAEFFGTASNFGTIVETAKFADSASNEGTVSGSAIFADTAVSNGIVEGAIQIAATAVQGENQTLTETPTEYIQPDGFFPNAHYSGGSRTAPAYYETVVYQVNGFWYKYDGSGNGSLAFGNYSDGSSLWFTFTKGVKGTIFHRFYTYLTVNNSPALYYFDNEPTSNVPGLNNGVPYEGVVIYASESSSIPAANLTGSGDDFDSIGGVDDIFFTNADGEFSYTLGVNVPNGFYSYGHYFNGGRIGPANFQTLVHQIGGLWYKYDGLGNASLASGNYSDGSSIFVFENGVKGEAYITPPEVGVYFTSNYTCYSPYGGCYGDYMNLGNWLNVNCDPIVTVIPSGADACIIVSDNSSIDIPGNLCLNTIILNGGCVVSPANFIFANIIAYGDARVTSIGIRNGTVSLYNTSFMGDADLCDSYLYRYDNSTRNNNIALLGYSYVYDCRGAAGGPTGVYFVGGSSCDYFDPLNWLDSNCNANVGTIPNNSSLCIFIQDNACVNIPAGLQLNTITLNGGCMSSPANEFTMTVVACGDSIVHSIGICGNVSLYDTACMYDSDIFGGCYSLYESSSDNGNVQLKNGAVKCDFR